MNQQMCMNEAAEIGIKKPPNVTPQRKLGLIHKFEVGMSSDTNSA